MCWAITSMLPVFFLSGGEWGEVGQVRQLIIVLSLSLRFRGCVGSTPKDHAAVIQHTLAYQNLPFL